MRCVTHAPGSFVLGSDHVWLVDLRNQMASLISNRAAADAEVERDEVAHLKRLEIERQITLERDKAEAARLQEKKDRAAARRARGSIILEAHDLLVGGRRVETSISERMKALGLALADKAGITHGEVDAASLVEVLQR